MPAIGRIGRVALFPKNVGELGAWVDRVAEEFVRRGVAADVVRVDNVDTSVIAAADVVVVLGGDGTFLAAARWAAPQGKPVLGINLGTFGFLAEYERDAWQQAVGDLLDGRVRLERRMMMTCREGRGTADWALNDVVVNKAALARMIDIELRVDGQDVSRFRADGLIVSTPVGSTAYNLSAGGPIVQPSEEVFVITPICPHQLTFRPLVVPSTAVIDIRVDAAGDDAYITIDGQVGRPLTRGARIHVECAPEPLQLVSGPDKRFYNILKRKLGWGGGRVD
jgi:NAD+ kinase